MVSDRLRLQIQRVGAVIRDVIVEGGHLLSASADGGPAKEGLANTLSVDLDSHPTTLIVDDEPRRTIHKQSEKWRLYPPPKQIAKLQSILG